MEWEEINSGSDIGTCDRIYLRRLALISKDNREGRYLTNWRCLPNWVMSNVMGNNFGIDTKT